MPVSHAADKPSLLHRPIRFPAMGPMAWLAFKLTFPAMLVGVFGFFIFYWLVPPPMIGHLGAEYDNTARTFIYSGTYGGPFDIYAVPSPTAWVTPILVFLLVILRSIFPLPMVVFVLEMLQFAAAWTAMWMLLVEGKRIGELKSAIWIVVGALAANLSQLFGMTHDTGLLLLVNCVFWYAMVRLWNGPSGWRQAAAWGAYGGFLALCSPTVGFVWAALTAGRWLAIARQSKNTQIIKQLSIAAVVSMLMITPWTIRNYVVFHRFIPIKSNGMFELWQAQCGDDDGVFDIYSCKDHPYAADGELRRSYARMGEMAFIDEKAVIAKEAIAAHPGKFLKRVGNRFMAAFVSYVPFSYQEVADRPLPYYYKKVVYLLPLLAMVVIALRLPRPWPPQLSVAVWIWVLTLTPYVIVSFYDRYATPLLLVKLIVVLYGWSALKAWVEEES